MDHQDHINLLKAGIPGKGGVWADFGSGWGAFTLALAELLGPTGVIYSIDVDQAALRQQEKALAARFPKSTLYTRQADFSRPLELPPLDGLVVANALHFLAQKDQTIRLLAGYLRPGGRFLVVEYDTDRGNRWVPHPFSFPGWGQLARRNGLEKTELLATAPSSFLGRFYAAVSFKPAK